nr:sodium:dicarboxylate symporter family [uncultured bacterium]
MIEWITHLWTSLTWQNALLGVGMFIVSFTVSLALVSFVLVKLPANYFHSSHAREFWVDRHRALRWSGLVLKNLIGLVLIILGIIMSLPGVPGQGILTILLGLIMLDIPGKRPLETGLVRRPKVLNSINRLREKFGKPPLILD